MASSAKFCGATCRQAAHRQRRSGVAEHPGDRLTEFTFAQRIGFADYLDEEGFTDAEEIREPFVIADLRLTPMQLRVKYGLDAEIELLGWQHGDGIREWISSWDGSGQKIEPWPHPEHWPLHDPEETASD